MKISSQSKPFTNVESLSVNILESYTEELNPLHPEEKNTKQKFSSYAKIGKLPKMIIGRIKL